MSTVVTSPSETPAKQQRFKLTTSALIGIAVIAFWGLVAIFAPLIAPYEQGEMISTESFKQVEEAAFLGTDYLGRDLLSRIIYGARMTLGLAAIATALSDRKSVV